MVWGCMSALGVGNVDFLETIMGRFGYLNIWKKKLKDSAFKLCRAGLLLPKR